MEKALIIHGYPDKEEYFDPSKASPSNCHWIPWMQKQLIVNGILAQTPEMPDAWEPRYIKWKEEFEQFTIDKNTILIGHSCGAGFLVRWLSENKTIVGKVFLVAPWIDPSGEKKKDILDFFDFIIDPLLEERTNGITVFISDDDDLPMLNTVKILEDTIKNIKIIKMHNKGHFVFGDMGAVEFPELLEEIIK